MNDFAEIGKSRIRLEERRLITADEHLICGKSLLAQRPTRVRYLGQNVRGNTKKKGGKKNASTSINLQSFTFRQTIDFCVPLVDHARRAKHERRLADSLSLFRVSYTRKWAERLDGNCPVKNFILEHVIVPSRFSKRWSDFFLFIYQNVSPTTRKMIVTDNIFVKTWDTSKSGGVIIL